MISKNRKIFFVLLAAAAWVIRVESSNAQTSLNVKASFNNLFRYGSGKEILNGRDSRKEYFENISDGRLQINDIVFGVRYEKSAPIEYGSDFSGIKKRFVEYIGLEAFSLRAGDFWEVIGRGLSMNTFEQRQFFYDTGIDGARVIFKKTIGGKNPVKIKSEIFGGNIEYRDFLQPERVETYDVRDINLEISPIKNFNLGLNYVYSGGRIPSGDAVTNIKAYIPEFFVSLNLAGLQVYSAYARKHTNTEANTLYPYCLSANGDAYYGAVSFTRPGFGATLEYKNYRFDITTPDNRSMERPTKMLPFQNPPTAIKEHTTTLTSRNPHVTDFNDEVGGQLELMWVPDNSLILVVNGSISSGHYRFSDIDTGSRVVFRADDRKYDFLPSLDDPFSPYWEISAEAEFYVSEKICVKTGLYHQYGILYNNLYSEGSDKRRHITIPVELRCAVGKIHALKIIFENQWADYSLRPPESKRFTNQYASIGYTRSPSFSFSLSSEFTGDYSDLSGKKFWLEGEFSYNVNPSNVVIVSYGSERGGLRCTSGICRYVNPFDGFRLTVQSKF